MLLGLNGLRVSEACATNIEDLGFERGHRTLQIIGKDAKPAMIPLVPRTGRTIDLAIGERVEGPILRRRDSRRLDRRTAYRWVRSIARRGGLGAGASPHVARCVHQTPHSTPAYRYETSNQQPATPTQEPRPSMTTGDRTSTDTPPTSSSPSSPAADTTQKIRRSGTLRTAALDPTSGGRPARRSILWTTAT